MNQITLTKNNTTGWFKYLGLASLLNDTGNKPISYSWLSRYIFDRGIGELKKPPQNDNLYYSTFHDYYFMKTSMKLMNIQIHYDDLEQKI